LLVQGHLLTSQALESVTKALDRVWNELQQCAESLRQFSEQNWTLSESLLDALGGGGTNDELLLDNDNEMSNNNKNKGAILAREKRLLADLEDELRNRIESLLEVGQLDGERAEQDDEEDKESQETSQDTPTPTNDKNGNRQHAHLLKPSISSVCAELWNMTDKRSNAGEGNGDTHNRGGNPKMDADQHTCLKGSSSTVDHELLSENGPEQHQQQFSYPETMQGLDHHQEQKERNHGQRSPDATADVDFDKKDENDEDEDDDDETIGDTEAGQEVVAAQAKLGQSQQSIHSVISNEETSTTNQNPHQNSKPIGGEDNDDGDASARPFASESQVRHAEDLLLFANDRV